MTDRRQDFYDSGEVVYLNCAYQGPMPRVALDEVREALHLKETPHLITDEMHFTGPDRLRRALATLIGTVPERIAITDSATAGIMLVVSGLDWRAGDEVIVPVGTFPSNRFPWLSLESRGVKVHEISWPTGASPIEAFEAAISPRTRVISLGWVSYATGRRRDLATFGQLCRDRGILLVVDGTQGIGGLHFDVGETPCDLVACAGYKWMLGPYGIGFAYVSEELTERLSVANINWLSVVGSEDFNQLSACALELYPQARRFDRNETASFFNVSGAAASTEYLVKVTPRAIEAHVRGLLDRLLAGLPPHYTSASSLVPGERSNILSIATESAEETCRDFDRVRAAEVRVSLRENAIRISPGIYNTEADLDRVLELLHG